MKLPQEHSSAQVLVRFGSYVERRLLRAGYEAQASTVRAATVAIRNATRALEDLEQPEDAAMADRDAADDDLDETARLARLQLASSELGADKKEPYIRIYADGVGYFTRADLGEQEPRYTELISRLKAFLGETHPVRLGTVPTLERQLAAWKTSESNLLAARDQISLARVKRSAAIDAWRSEIEKLYGWLISEVGKKKAERFFPRTTEKKATKEAPKEGASKGPAPTAEAPSGSATKAA